MRAIRRVLLIVVGTLLVLALLVVGGAYLWMRGSLPQTEGEARIAALEAPVTVRRNDDGMVRIQAANEADLYRALGFVHAQERLWQMDFMRRTASGRLSEVMGEATLGLDRFFRTLGFRQLAEANLAVLSEETKTALQAYSEGVNAFLANRSGPLPLEFHFPRYLPVPMRPSDSLLGGRLLALRLS